MELKSVRSTAYHPEDLTIPLVVTYDNKLTEHPNSGAFRRTLESHAWEYAFISISDKYRDHRDKLCGYTAMLKTLPSDKIVVLSDSWDVVCCRTSKVFLEGYNTLKSDFVVSMELFCDYTTDVVLEPTAQCVPLVKYWKHHTQGVYPLRKYVNSGLMCGKAGALLEFFQYASENKFEDDQEAMGTFMNAYPEKVCADVDHTLLHSTTFGKSAGFHTMHIQKQDAPTYAEIFGRDSFFLHFPGCNTKGQKLMYDMTLSLIDQGHTSHKLNELYGYPDISWTIRMK